ncbi:MAG: 16S rRNA (guanine(527)-N(7))-methyltransferase RsmG [Arcanobacterium sp.]
MEQAPAGGVAEFGEKIWSQLLHLAELLESEGQLRGLVGPREMDKLWSRHILNSLAIIDFIPEGAKLADVGSGAGFPGLVTAIVRPDLDVHLIDSLGRRTDWLEYAVDNIGLSNVTIYNKRAEELHGKLVVDVVTARAVAALKKLIPYTLPLVKSGGQLVALKGSRAEIEVDESVKQLNKFNVDWVDIHDVDVWGTDEGTRVVVLQKL